MADEPTASDSVWRALAAPSERRASAWLESVRRGDVSAAEMLGGMQRDPESFEFTRRLIELVAGTQDAFTSAMGLREMAQEVPAAMPVRDRLAVRAGGVASLGLPWAVMPVARRWLRDRVSHLVLAAKLPTGATPGRLGVLTEALREHTEAGAVPVVVPLGDEVHGPAGALAEATRLAALASHPAVKHLVVDPARIAPGGSDWSADLDVTRAATALRPILAAAAEHDTTIHLEPTSVRWARVVPDVLVHALADAEFDRVRIGTRILAELPESREFYDRLSRWAQRRVADGGAPVEVVIGVSGVAGAERIASIQSGLAVPVLEDRCDVTAQLLRLVDLALHPGRAAVLRPVIASEDVRVLAAAVELAADRDIAELVSLQLRSGVAPGLDRVLAAEGSEIRIALPVISPQEFAGAVDTLVRIAAEAADPDSAVSRLEAMLAESSSTGAEPSSTGAEPSSTGPEDTGAEDTDAEGTDAEGTDAEPTAAGSGSGAEAAERALFAAAAIAAEQDAPTSHRTQRRAREWDPTERDSALFYRAPDEPARFETGGLTAAVLGLSRGSTGDLRLGELAPPKAIPAVSGSGFAAEPETDASTAENREWARGLLERAAQRTEERDLANETVALSPADLDAAAVAQVARTAGEQWAAQPHRIRAVRLRRGALAVVAARDRLLQALAVDTGAPIAELDAEINDIVDAGRYCGQLAEGLAAVRGATFVPDRLVMVVADAVTALSAQADAVLAGLAAGSGVLWVVPQRLHRSAAVLVEEWEVGGITAGAVRLETVFAGRTLGALAADENIDRAVVLGDRAEARDLARRRPDLRIEGHFRVRGSVLVSPSADIGSAIPSIVRSAFRAAGSHPRAVDALVLVAGAARSRRLREGLADAVRALRVGDTSRPGDTDALATDLGPLPVPPSEAGLRALTTLHRGEEWLVQPEQLDEEGRLWSPGVRTGVAPDSPFWEECRGVPVIGILHAHTLTEGVRLQNAPESGAVAGLFATDADEILAWLDTVEAASLSVNRPTTEARIERQPGGGWNDAVMGLPTLSGGPNWLLALGSWRPREGTRSETLHLRGLDPEVQRLIETAQNQLAYEEFDALRRATLSDALAWRTAFGVVRDTVGLGIERNVMRYWPVPTHIRLAEREPVAALLRVLAAALLVRAPVSVSTGEVLPSEVSAFLASQGIEVSLERDDDWMARIAVSGPKGADGVVAERVRLIGGDRVRVAEWMGGLDREALWAEPVTMAGPVELLTLLREQSVSARAHRHGLAVEVPGLDELLAE
ncbi:proline dehydrogenase family protein [Leucobacter rhizosphaerae]|uniref:Proline dehydrogenase family protein n=1 Tax=Leucobacter rhizosphaerae TaxID=2932245 RepID=A0ABY4FTR6_9MICO|nr:aldehyde dehydrogenase family protein [Leucobacter rhizosphaerae]UOQ59652.1 proline dehydrogenase family protein [Leucobacter rhizosphaerae]